MFKFLGSSETLYAIDLGTRNILITDKQKICFRQQTIAAYHAHEASPKRKYIVGDVAEELFEKGPTHYELIKPVNKGVICDLQV